MESTDIDYAAKAKKLSKAQREQILSRMTGNLPKRLKKEKLTENEALAIQLELEDEQLQEWRENVAAIREKALKAEMKAKEKLAKAAEKFANDKKTTKK